MSKSTTPPEMPKLGDFLCFAVYSANLAYGRAYKPILDKLGITYTQWIAIVALWEQDEQTVSALGDKLFLESNTLTPILRTANTLFSPQLKDEGILIIEEDLVRIGEHPAGTRIYSIPATRIAEELGKKMVLNIVMVGFFGAVSQTVDHDALRRAVAASVPEAYRELNLKAFDRGFEYGMKELSEVIVKQDSQVAVAALET